MKCEMTFPFEKYIRVTILTNKGYKVGSRCTEVGCDLNLNKGRLKRVNELVRFYEDGLINTLQFFDKWYDYVYPEFHSSKGGQYE